MIDVRRDMYDILARLVLAERPDAFVTNELALVPPAFPAVFIEQSFSSEVDKCRDSSGAERANALIWTFNIYSNSLTDPRGECEAILSVLDARMRLWNFKRLTARPISNTESPEIFRLVGRYTGLVDDKGNCYWR